MTATDQRKLVLQGQSTSSVLSVAIETGAVRGVQLSAHLSFPCRNPQTIVHSEGRGKATQRAGAGRCQMCCTCMKNTKINKRAKLYKQRSIG
jgi:hypothetical protein